MKHFSWLFLLVVTLELLAFDMALGKRKKKLKGRGGLRPSHKTRGNGFKSDEDCNHNKLLIVFDSDCVSSKQQVKSILSQLEDKFSCLTEDATKKNVIYYNENQDEYHAYLKINSDESCLEEDKIDYEQYCIEYVAFEPLLQLSTLSCEDGNAWSEHDNAIQYMWNLDAFDGNYDGSGGSNIFSYLTTDSSVGVDVYVLDTGVLSTHNEFSELQVIHMDSNWNDASIIDMHGTHVAGTIIGKTVGIARGLSNSNSGIKVYEYGVCRDGAGCGSQDILDGFQAVVDMLGTRNRRGVINMSFGGALAASHWLWATSAPYFAFMAQLGGIIVAAAGNKAIDACGYWPAASANIIATGSSDESGRVSSFSNYGSCVETYAPGSSIFSSSSSGNSAYSTLSGTSMASPYVAGLVAQMLAANQDIDFEDVVDVLTRNENSISLTSCPSSGSAPCRQISMHSCDELVHLSNGYRLNQGISCQTVWSGQSGTGDDATSSVSCPSGTIMTGCTGKTNWRNFDGSFISDGKCFARNGGGGGGVWAVARCCDITATCADVKSGLSGSNDDDIVTATCGNDQVLTGCTSDTFWYNMDGAYAGSRYIDELGDTNDVCVAQSGGSPVYANARCCAAGQNKELVCRAVYGEKSGSGDDHTSRVSCPNGYFLSGCSAYTFWKHLDGSYIDNDECVAQNGVGGGGVWPVAICCKEYEK